MKKTTPLSFILTISIVLLTALFTGCAQNEESEKSTGKAVALNNEAQRAEAADKSPKESARGLKVGKRVEDFSAVQARGGKFKLSEALKWGPVVVVFYRGQWCPFCNKHMSALNDSLNLITERGARLVAVSPEKPEYAKKMIEKLKTDFSLLYDEGYAIASLFDVLFQPDEATIELYNDKLNAELKTAHSDDSQRLPVPATFILDKNGVIVWRQFDTDYKIRANVNDIVKNLP
ncbi:MAG: peroxiredoxin-like family protein [Cryomorphaceae bacterium]|nr:AhpC/TSA family protein [Flavobacteriales bacterium]